MLIRKDNLVVNLDNVLTIKVDETDGTIYFEFENEFACFDFQSKNELEVAFAKIWTCYLAEYRTVIL